MGILYMVVQMMDQKEVLIMVENYLKIDGNRTGVVTFEELKKAYLDQNVKINDKQLQEIFKNCILNRHDQAIRFSEFLVAAIDVKKFVKEDMIQAIFSLFDINSNS